MSQTAYQCTARQPAGDTPRRGAVAASVLLHAAAVAALFFLSFNRPVEEAPLVIVRLEEMGLAGGGEGPGPSAAEAPSTSGTQAAPAEAATAVAAPAPPEPQVKPPPVKVVTPPKPRPAPKPAPAIVKPTPAPVQLAQVAEPPSRLPPASPAPVSAAGDAAAGAGAGAGGATAGRGGNTSGPDTGAGFGAGDAGAGPGDDYLDRLRRWIAQHKHYPRDAISRKQEGTVLVAFVIERDGSVHDAQIERSSGFPLLDQAVLDTLRDASPVPPLPDTYKGQRGRIALPISFSLGFFQKLF